MFVKLRCHNKHNKMGFVVLTQEDAADLLYIGQGAKYKNLMSKYKENMLRVRGTDLTSVKEVMTKGLLPPTILPPSIPPSTTLPPHRRLGGEGVG